MQYAIRKFWIAKEVVVDSYSGMIVPAKFCMLLPKQFGFALKNVDRFYFHLVLAGLIGPSGTQVVNDE